MVNPPSHGFVTPMRRAVLLPLLLAYAALHPVDVRAQTATVRTQAAPDSACSYSQCALRVEYRFLSTRLVRGAAGESVGRLGWFGSGVGVLLAGPDSAAYHARQYQSRRRTTDALGIVSGALAIVGLTLGRDDIDDAGPFLLAGATLELASLPFWLGSRRSLDRAVWWYNRDLPRP
jgi:hypothetical protein